MALKRNFIQDYKSSLVTAQKGAQRKQNIKDIFGMATQMAELSQKKQALKLQQQTLDQSAEVEKQKMDLLTKESNLNIAKTYLDKAVPYTKDAAGTEIKAIDMVDVLNNPFKYTWKQIDKIDAAVQSDQHKLYSSDPLNYKPLNIQEVATLREKEPYSLLLQSRDVNGNVYFYRYTTDSEKEIIKQKMGSIDPNLEAKEERDYQLKVFETTIMKDPMSGDITMKPYEQLNDIQKGAINYFRKYSVPEVKEPAKSTINIPQGEITEILRKFGGTQEMWNDLDDTEKLELIEKSKKMGLRRVGGVWDIKPKPTEEIKPSFSQEDISKLINKIK